MERKNSRIGTKFTFEKKKNTKYMGIHKVYIYIIILFGWKLIMIGQKKEKEN